MHVAGAVTDAESAFRLILDTRPDVAVVGLNLPGRGSFDMVADLAARQNETNVLFLTDHLSDVFIDEALRLNARGYLMKHESVETVVKSIRRVADGETCFSTEIEQRLEYDSQQKTYKLHTKGHLQRLTSRQLEVLRYLARGRSVKETAKEMHLSAKSVDSHKYRIMKNLGIHDRVELARYAIREGLVLP